MSVQTESVPLVRPIPPSITEAQNAFCRDLPQLLRERPGQWVAYRGGEQIGFAARDLDLYDECQRRGFADDEYLVLCIELEADVVLLGHLQVG